MSGQYGPRTGVYTVGGIDRFDTAKRPLRPVDNVSNLPLDKVDARRRAEDRPATPPACSASGTSASRQASSGQRGFDEAIVSMGKHFDFDTQPKVEYPKGAYLADFLTDNAVEFIDRNKDEPFFLYLPHFGVHAPHEAKQDLIEQLQEEAGSRRAQRPDLRGDDRQRRRERRPRGGEARRTETGRQHARHLHVATTAASAATSRPA